MRLLAVILILPLFLLFILSVPLLAQDEVVPVPDSGLVIVEEQNINYGDLQNRSPTGAMLRSMVFPGWGQLYNRKYIKALVVFGGETYLVAQAIRYWSKTDDWFEKYTSTEDNALRYQYYNNEYLFYKDCRNLYLYFSGLAIFLSMVDAYVDAHLANFDIDITPPFDPESDGRVSLTLKWRF